MPTKVELREKFIYTCAPQTQEIHLPIIDLAAHNGALNPAGRGDAAKFSADAPGQSSTAFHTVDAYEEADRTGIAYNGGAEYAVVRSASAARVCNEFARRYNGEGAVILPSGLSAINTVLSAYLHSGSSIMVPDNCYAPTIRALNALRVYVDEDGHEHKNRDINVYFYPGNSSADDIKARVKNIRRLGGQVDVIYMESPGSVTFETADTRGIAEFADKADILTILDSSYFGVLDSAPEGGVSPLDYGVRLLLKATTKYETGFGDTPSGIVIARLAKDHKRLSRETRFTGNGAVAPETCNRLFHRVAGAGERMAEHYNNAMEVFDWLEQQPFVQEVLAPYRPNSPDHKRFREYCSTGNGLGTIRFKPEISRQQVKSYANAFNLIPTGESWGMEPSLLHMEEWKLRITPLPHGQLLRLSIGREAPRDIIRDMKQAIPALDNDLRI